MIASKRETEKAFKKLVKAFPENSVMINLSCWRFNYDNSIEFKYRAYRAVGEGCHGKESESPMEAVNSLIELSKGEQNESE